MEPEKRIRLDFIGKNRVSMTKSTIVEAVRILEQDPNVTINGSFREVVDSVYKAMWLTRKDTTVTVGIAWNNKNNNDEFSEAKMNIKVEYGRIDNLPVYMVLPKAMAKLIETTGFVTKSEPSDEFE